MSTRLKGWISSSLSQADALESGLNQIQDGMYLATAVGVQLDLTDTEGAPPSWSSADALPIAAKEYAVYSVDRVVVVL